MCGRCSWEEFVEKIDDLQTSGDFDWAEDTLAGIDDWVQREKHITNKQKEAVENIEDGAFS